MQCTICTMALVTCKRSSHLGLRFCHHIQVPHMSFLEKRKHSQIAREDSVLASRLQPGEASGVQKMRAKALSLPGAVVKEAIASKGQGIVCWLRARHGDPQVGIKSLMEADILVKSTSGQLAT